MNFVQTVDFLFSKTLSYQNIGAKAFNKSLSKTLDLTNLLNNPQHSFKSIHIAGTNGKGSTSSMLASIFQEAGYKVGLYTSPHLVSFTERIKINGIEIEEAFVVDFVERLTSFIEAEKPSFFEITTLMAFDYFRFQKVDLAIIETGLGGRLDSTNIVFPEVSVITSISLDHQAILGNSIAEIAAEKGGIIKQNVPVVFGKVPHEAYEVLQRIAKTHSAPFCSSQDVSILDKGIENGLRIIEFNGTVYELPLLGNIQLENIKTVFSVLKHFDIPVDAVQKGLRNTVKNTCLKGRFQVVRENPKVVADVAHNEEGIKQLFEQALNEKYDNLLVVFGMVSDKDAEKVIQLLPQNTTYFLCKPSIERGMDVELLASYFTRNNLNFKVFSSVEEAYNNAFSSAKANDFILVGGSSFVVADFLSFG